MHLWLKYFLFIFFVRINWRLFNWQLKDVKRASGKCDVLDGCWDWLVEKEDVFRRVVRMRDLDGISN